MARCLFGATDLEFREFRGLVEDTDATELPADRAAAALNIDFDGDTLRKRLGRARLNASPFAGTEIRGLHAYYPKEGGARKLLAATSAAVRVDAGDSFGTLLSGGSGNRPIDFVPWQDKVYYTSDVPALYVWDGANSGLPVQAPLGDSLPAPTITEQVIQNFADATDWTSTAPGDLDATDLTTGGNPVMLLTASSGVAVGAWVEAAWSAGATVDLSLHSQIKFRFSSGYQHAQFQFGVKRNDDSIAWLDLFIVETAGQWTEQAVNLGSIDPSLRTASTGLAIAFVQPLTGAGYPQSIVFESAYLTAGFEADTYRYYLTYYNEDAAAAGKPPESNASDAASITLAPGHRAASIDLTIPYSLDPDITHVRIYRKRDDAPYAQPRLVVELANNGVVPVYSDYRTDAELLLENAAEWTTQYQLDPPLADCYTVAGTRLVAGAVTVEAEYYPWRFYLSRFGQPWAFSSAQNPTDPLDAGWVDLPERDRIVRILDVDGNLLLFCERSIWTLTGTGWDDFVLEKRAEVGLSARWAVAVYGRLVLFLASDGVRALDLAFGANPRLSSWVLSEPVANRLRAIPGSLRGQVAFGVDERERLHVSHAAPGATTNNAALVLDLRVPGALTNKQDPTRPGWTYYTGWGFRCFETLKRGGGDNGQLLGGDVAAGTVWWCGRNGAGAELLTDDGAAIPWSWTSAAADTGRGRQAPLVYVAAETDPAAGQSVTLSAVQDRGASEQSVTLPLGAATTGIVSLLRRIAGQARYVQLRVSGEHSVSMRMRSGAVGVWPAKVGR